MSAFLPQHDALAVTRELSLPFSLDSGRIAGMAANGAFKVLVGDHERILRCATSCLVAPEPGDLVLVAGNSDEGYVLAVLERPGPAPAVLNAATPSDVMVLGAKKLVMRAEEEIEIVAPQTNIRGKRFTIAVEALSVIANLLSQTLGRWQSSAQKIDTVATDIATKAARRVTIVDETDMLEAGAIVQRIDAASVTNAQAVVIAAGEDLRLDGARVTVG
ncbi:MAG: DUF3540 domain-containing protein [Methylovirgula sp.]